MDVNARNSAFKDSLGDNPLNVIFGDGGSVEDDATNSAFKNSSANQNRKMKIVDLVTPSRVNEANAAAAGMITSPLQS